MACDTADPAQVARLIKDAQTTMPPICGIIHSAMVLRDILFERMSHEDYTAVINSKVPGAWNFHNALKAASIPLDFFICLSSVAGIVGNRGQAAYAAANTFLDAFCAYRRTLGMPATSIDLTAVTGVGYLATNMGRQNEILQNLGDDTLNEAEVLALVTAAIDGTMNRTCGGHCITGLKIQLGGKEPFWASDAKFKRLREAAAAASQLDANSHLETPTKKPLPRQLEQCETPEQVLETVVAALMEKLSAVLMIPVADMDPATPVTALGLDSLVAIEIRNWIVRECDANLQVLELLSTASLKALAEAIVKKSKLSLKRVENV